jgi:hypothetical protein
VRLRPAFWERQCHRGSAAASARGSCQGRPARRTRFQSAGSPRRGGPGASPRPRRPSSSTAASIWTECWSMRGTASSGSLTSGAQRAPALGLGSGEEHELSAWQTCLCCSWSVRGSRRRSARVLRGALRGTRRDPSAREPRLNTSPRLLPTARCTFGSRVRGRAAPGRALKGACARSRLAPRSTRDCARCNVLAHRSPRGRLPVRRAWLSAPAMLRRGELRRP